MRGFRAWLTVRHFLLRFGSTGGYVVTSPVLTVLVGIYEHYWRITVPWWAYGVLLYAPLLIACFLAWKDEHRRALARAEEISPADWLALAKDFDAHQNVFAHWERRDSDYSWHLGTGSPQDPGRVNSLCHRAGQMLCKSPKFKNELDRLIGSQTNPVVRWLCFVKECNHLREDNTLQAESYVLGHPTGKTVVHGGTVMNVGKSSADACHHCAAIET